MIEIIRKELKTCDKSRYRIASETGISENQLHRLIYGGSLKAETCDTLLQYFGYELIKKKGRKRK